MADLENQLSKANHEIASLQDRVGELESENKELQDTLDSAKYNLEQETLTRVDLQNQVQSLREELNFKRNVYDKVRLSQLGKISRQSSSLIG